MKIVLWGTYDKGKPRIRILCEGLRALGVHVSEIHANVWEDTPDKSTLRGVLKWLRRGLRLLAVYPGLVWRYLRAPEHDVVLVSYPGQFDVLVLLPFAGVRRRPVVYDWFISAFDTVVEDRRLIHRWNPLARILWMAEWLAPRGAALTFMDTATHARRMERLFGLAPNSLGHVWVGAEKPFFQSQAARRPDSGSLRVLFYGQFIPLHGIGTIIQAARLLRDVPIQWILIGRGQEAPRIRAMLEEQPLANLTWVDWVPYEDLPLRISMADVCLGIFGTSAKAASVIPNKVFQVVASSCPLVTRDSPAIRELLTDAFPCVRFVTAGDARSLADAVYEQYGQLNTRTSPCHQSARERITPRAVAQQFLAAVEQRIPNASMQDDR